MTVALTASAYDISVRSTDGQVFQAPVDNIKIMDFDSAESPLKFTGTNTNVIKVGNRAQDLTITFDASMYWIVSDIEEADWIRVGNRYGKSGANAITVSLDANKLAVGRTAKFTVLCGFCPVEFSITQDVDGDAGFVDITDDNFLAYCLENFDSDGDGRISVDEAAKVTSIDVTEKKIASLSGIRSFVNLEELICSYNDISGDLDLSGFTKLKRLSCDHNYYTSLNVSGCPVLEYLKANDNYKVDSRYNYIYSLERVNLSGCSAIKELILEENALTSVDLSDLVNLTDLRMTHNQLTSIDLSHNVSLVNAHLRRNPMDGSHLDLSKCVNLRTVFTAESNIGSVNVNGCRNLETLDMTYNLLTSLDLSGCPKLKRLEAYSNQLTSIDVSKCPELTSLWIASNKISHLDVSNNPELTNLIASDNGIEGSLDLTANTKLEKIELYKNKLTDVKFVPMTSLEQLLINNNELTSLDLSGMTNLLSLVASSNQLSSINLKGCGTISVMNIDANPLETIDLSECTGLVSVDMNNCHFSTLDLTASPNLMELFVNYNQLKDIKLSGLDKLATLEIYNNLLERLDVRGCLALNQIQMQNNNMEYFSPRECPALSYIDLRNNRIKGIDFSSNDYLDRAFGKGNPCKVVYLSENASNMVIEFDESCEIYLGHPKDFNDVGGGNWGDTDINPWK